jgi:hypothetical protein
LLAGVAVTAIVTLRGLQAWGRRDVRAIEGLRREIEDEPLED